MRVWIGFVIAVAVVAAPLTVAAQETMNPEPWLEAEFELYALGAKGRRAMAVTDAEPSGPVFAFIPPQSRMRMPQEHNEPASSVDPWLRLRLDEPEGLRVTPGSPAEGSRRGLSRPARIAIGVVVPVVVLAGIGVGVGAVVAMNNIYEAP